MKYISNIWLLAFISCQSISNEQDTLLIDIQTKLNSIDSGVLAKLEKLNLANLKSLDGNPLTFVPIDNGVYKCGVIYESTESPHILYTLQFSKETEEWIPIEGDSIKKSYWDVSL